MNRMTQITISCSVNKSITNKATPGQYQTLTDEFEPFAGNIDQFCEEVKLGHAFSPAVLTSNETGKYIKKTENFQGAELLFIDIDNTMLTPDGQKRMMTEAEGYLPLEKVINNEWVKKRVLCVYTSFNHTDQHNKFRIVFLLPYFEENPDEYKTLVAAFIKRFNSDSQTSSIVNAFYGNTKAEIYPFGKQLAQKDIQQVKNYAKEFDRPQVSNSHYNGSITPEYIRHLLSFLPKWGEYIWWSRIVSAVASCVPDKIDETTAANLIQEWSPGRKSEVISKVKNRMSKISFGTLVYEAKQNGYIPERKNQASEQNVYKRTELGNAERFVDKFKGYLYFEHRSKMWYIWDEKYFKLDETGIVYSMAKKIVRNIILEATDTEKETHKKVVEWAHASESRSKITNMLALAANGTELATVFDEFDKYPMQLNLNNGIFDINDWKLYEHTNEEIHTKIIPINYDDNAACPRWIEFLNTVFNNNEELINFIQRAVGYSLTALTSEQCLFFCYGTGKNGKSVFFSVMEMLLGDYSQKAPTEMLMLQKNAGIPNDVARLRGVRFAVAAELPEDKRFNEQKIKDLTGGDKLVARYLHGEYFEFNPCHKLWIYGNHKPIITGTDNGIWRRIKIVPFEVTIPEEKRRPYEELMQEFKAELPGILKWALDGCYLWKYNGGLKDPQAVTDASNDYRKEMDVLDTFLQETVVERQGGRVKNKDLYSRYKQWTIDNNEYCLSGKKFAKHLRERGWMDRLEGNSQVTWVNFAMLDEPQGNLNF